MPVPFREQLKNHPGMGPVLLFVLPLPLLLVILHSLVTGNPGALLAALGSLGFFWCAAWFLRRAHYLEWKSRQKKWHRSSRFPWRYMASLLTGAGVFTVSLLLLQHHAVVAVIAALLGVAGVVLRYGVDPQHDRSKDTNLVGITTEELIEILEEAEANLESLENSAKKINNRELKTRINDISNKTRGILEIIEADPKDVRKARKFLKVYLHGAQKVAMQYANLHPSSEDQSLEQNFRNVLNTIEQVIEEQKTRLLENDILDLDVKIEVLEAQLKHEGIT